ncbi:hypothetical protein Tco_0319814 [Tanacetum coccineum]
MVQAPYTLPPAIKAVTTEEIDAPPHKRTRSPSPTPSPSPPPPSHSSPSSSSSSPSSSSPPPPRDTLPPCKRFRMTSPHQDTLDEAMVCHPRCIGVGTWTVTDLKSHLEESEAREAALERRMRALKEQFEPP